ncbi:DUF6168 family protein [Polaribacter sp. NJDZ03]|uniref:DUF6168 family protein n=1 Tax=unclassified Polaribacter TaxID=196858 RepID=UPI001C4A735B|nr:DUF6168 family protein [Polaribacter sp. NJDZ03]
MIKIVITYCITLALLFIICFFSHSYLIEKQGLILHFKLVEIYEFNVGFSILVCTNFVAFSFVDKFKQKLSYIYLGAIFIKLILFKLAFYDTLFVKETLSVTEKLSLLIPTVIFLSTDAFFVAKLLNKKQ